MNTLRSTLRTGLRTGLIGDHIGATRLPAALGLMCDAAGIAIKFELIDTGDRGAVDFTGLVDGLRAKGWTGVSVTHPYKQAAAAYAGAAMAPDLRALGAANTLVFGARDDANDSGRVAGFNTDYTGFLSAWATHMGQRPVGAVALAGAGGVARALGPALAGLGARDIAICDPSPGRAADLARVIGACARVVAPDRFGAVIAAADGLVNATPLGMGYAPGTAFDPVHIGAQTWAFDAVYTPTDTAFLADCTRAGLVTLSGFELFRHMAMRSFETYTGVAPEPGRTLAQLAKLRPG